MKLRQLALVSCLIGAGLLSACGGSGGDSGPAAPNTIILNSTNGKLAADAALDGVNNSNTTSSIGIFATDGSQASGGYGVLDLTRDVLESSRSGLNTGQFAVAVVQTGFCDNEPGGFVDVVQSGPNSGSAAFNNCQLGDVYINGDASLFITSDTPSATSGSMSFHDLSVSDITGVLFSVNGDFNFTETATTMTISGSSITITAGLEYLTLANFNIYTSTNGTVNSTIIYSLTISSNIMGGAVSVTTSPAEGGATVMQYENDPYPFAGSIVVIGANNTRVRLTAMGDGSPLGIARIDYDIDGLPGYETFEDLTWAELDAVGGN